MIVSIIIASIIGLIVGGLTGISFIGWAVGIIAFLFCLPGALAAGFVFDSISYAQDRADLRQEMADYNADIRAEEDRKHNRKQINIDKRSIHFYGGNK